MFILFWDKIPESILFYFRLKNKFRTILVSQEVVQQTKFKIHMMKIKGSSSQPVLTTFQEDISYYFFGSDGLETTQIRTEDMVEEANLPHVK